MGKSHEKHATKVETDCNDDLEIQKDVSAPVHEEKSKNKVERADSEENDKFEATLKKRKNLSKAEESKDCLNLKKPKKHVLMSLGRVTSFNDLPLELIGDKILSKVPLTSLRAVRSTCKLWNALSKEWMLGKEPTSKRQLTSFIMTIDSKFYSLRIHSLTKNYSEAVLSRNRMHVDILDQVKVSQVFHCDGLLLCVLEDKSRLLVWNPYSGQTRLITNCHECDMYALGYDKNRNHKILTVFDDYDPINEQHSFKVETYDFRSHSWRARNTTGDSAIEYDPNVGSSLIEFDPNAGASLKGNTYFFAQKETPPGGDDDDDDDDDDDGGSIAVSGFLICLDFTKEGFGPRLPLPFHLNSHEGVTLSCVGEEQLVVLHERLYTRGSGTYEFWKTTKIEPDAVSWSKFLEVEIVNSVGYLTEVVSFFINEEEKVAVVVNEDRYEPSVSGSPLRCNAFIREDDGYLKTVLLDKYPAESRPPRVCSSPYLPSVVQIN